MDTPASRPPAVETVAETWHTVLLLAIVIAWFYLGRMRLFYLQGHPSFNHIAFYLRLILWESALVGYIAWGVHRQGGSLRAIIGGRWDSAKKVFIDFGVATLFWFGSILCLGVLGATLLRLGAPPAPQVTRTLPSPQGPRSVQVPRVVNVLAPRSNTEIPVWIVLCLVVGFCEEVIFRGYFQRQFAAWTNRPIAIILSAALFGLGHGYQGTTAQVVLGFFGLLFGILAEMRKSLRPGIVAHVWHDLIAGLVLTFLRRFAGG